MISFALLSNDRLLVVEFAEIELLVFELLWKNHYGATDGSQPAAEENGNAKRGLFAGEMAETSDDLGNVSSRYHGLQEARNAFEASVGKSAADVLSLDEKLLCCIGGQAVDVFRVDTEEESAMRMVSWRARLRGSTRRSPTT
ncbi:hypothetical protein L596_022087 [Steinernema carpocapsae]|uniref:Uncharacterized protein n=1 Tax=Steinernema carpocapsae TaxID=34508 RepID=A0A4U5MKS4_STECR|nr:hypothetical protein L596_022087 [Steinernema carpocapsae]